MALEPQKHASTNVKSRNIVNNMAKAGIDQNMVSNSSQRLIMTALSDRYPDASYEDKKNAAKEVALAERGAEVKIGKETINVNELRTKVADTISEDMAYRVASSIEAINSETDSENEYYRMIEDAHDIIKRCNDGEVTVDDDRARSGFVDNMGQREVELMRCLSLYQASGTDDAKAKAQFIYLKLNKLRELKRSVEATSKGSVGHHTTKEEYERAIQYWVAIKGLEKSYTHETDLTDEQYREKLRRLMGMENLSEQEKAKLGLRGYEKLQQQYVYKEATNEFTQMQLEAAGADKSPSEFFIASKNRDLGQLLRKHRGIQSTQEMLDEQASYRQRKLELRKSYGREGSDFRESRFMELQRQEQQLMRA